MNHFRRDLNAILRGERGTPLAMLMAVGLITAGVMLVELVIDLIVTVAA